jgi:hypothetical protein
LRHRDEGDVVPIKLLDELREIQQRTGKPVDFITDDAIDLARLDIPE